VQNTEVIKEKVGYNLNIWPNNSIWTDGRFPTKINDNFSTVFLQEHFSHSCPKSKDKSGGRAGSTNPTPKNKCMEPIPVFL
jgi:hypothetical protein